MDAFIKSSTRLRLGVILISLLIPVYLLAADGFQEDFSSGLNDAGLPKGWKLKQWNGRTRKIETVEEGGKPVLHLTSEKNSFGLYRDFELEPKATPIVSWRWKAARLPDGGDVREKEKDDQADRKSVV